MDAAAHGLHVDQVKAWFAIHAGHEMSITVRSGANVVPVAAGPFLGLEEHPVNRGVFRAMFSDARRVSLNPDEEKFISFGSELQAVDAGTDRLVLDKGAQSIEIVDLEAVAPPMADEVTWPAPAVAAPPPPPQAAPAPPVAPLVAPAAAAQVFEMPAKAPFYGNSLGSAFVGPITIRIEQGWATITGHRSPGRSMLATGGMALLVPGAICLVFGLVVAGNATGNSDMGFAFCLMGVGLVGLLIGGAMYLVGRSKAMRQGEESSLQFRLADAGGRKVRYDSNVGCLFMLLLTPVIGLIIMLALGRRVVHMTVPNDRGSRPPRQVLVIKTYSSADGAMLNAALRG